MFCLISYGHMNVMISWLQQMTGEETPHVKSSWRSPMPLKQWQCVMFGLHVMSVSTGL